MPKLTVIVLESDYDKEVIRIFCDKLVEEFTLSELATPRMLGKRLPTLRKQKNRGKRIKAELEDVVKHFLQEDDYVLFLYDIDGSISKAKRLNEPNSLINQVKRVLENPKFSGRVFRVEIVNELESWLLVDCAGIFCHFAKQTPVLKNKNRADFLSNRKYTNLIDKYQSGNTEMIVEAQIGGKGAKEYLEKFSEEIILAINPSMPNKNVKQKRYRERDAPQIAKDIQLTNKTIKRNGSLVKFRDLLQQLNG